MLGKTPKSRFGGEGGDISPRRLELKKGYGYKKNEDVQQRDLDNFFPLDAEMDVPVEHHSSTMRQLGAIQPKRMLYLHELLEKMVV